MGDNSAVNINKVIEVFAVEPKVNLGEKIEIVGSHAGKGKTSYCVERAVDELIAGNSVLFFSTETTLTETFQRFRSSILSRNVGNTEEELEANKVNLQINDSLFLSLDYIREEIREKSLRTEGLDYVVIDGLGFVTIENGVVNEIQNVEDVAEGLKEIAEEFGCKILGSVQLKRTSENSN